MKTKVLDEIRTQSEVQGPQDILGAFLLLTRKNSMLKKFTLILIMLLAVGLASGCTNEPSARRTLEAAGYNNISFTGYDMFSCSDQDFYATGFKAVGHNG